MLLAHDETPALRGVALASEGPMFWIVLAMAITMTNMLGQSVYHRRRRPSLARFALLVAVGAGGVLLATLLLWLSGRG